MGATSRGVVEIGRGVERVFVGVGGEGGVGGVGEGEGDDKEGEYTRGTVGASV